jgi:hypothetical protein
MDKIANGNNVTKYKAITMSLVRYVYKNTMLKGKETMPEVLKKRSNRL